MGASSSKRVVLPGVVYSENYVPPTPEEMPGPWRGSMQHVIEESVPKPVRASLELTAQTARPTPEDTPYTWWERCGLVPVHVSRLRPRQYYHPTTDFRYYDYDEMSPEEKELKERWLARLLDINWALPSACFSAWTALTVAFPTKLRMPLIMFGAGGSVMIESYRVFFNALPERQDLDDYIMTKECWYIKNVETPQLELTVIDPKAPKQPQRTRVSFALGDE